MNDLQYLDAQQMRAIDVREFQQTHPYPWCNPLNFVRPDKLKLLIASLPPVEQFAERFDYVRKHGQQSHNRYVLDYVEGMQLDPHWQDFVAELRSDSYRDFVRRLLDVRRVKFSFQWHYTPRGASVSPHVDSRRKIGSHIFYLNTASDWKPEWGGQTLVLDDRGKFDRKSNPAIESFATCEEASNDENRSLIFGRGRKSWHAVRSLECPEGVYRRIFIVRYEKDQRAKRLWKRWRTRLTGDAAALASEDYLY